MVSEAAAAGFANRYRVAESQNAETQARRVTEAGGTEEEAAAARRAQIVRREGDNLRAQARSDAEEWSRTDEAQDLINNSADAQRGAGGRYFGLTNSQARERERQRLVDGFAERRTNRLIERRSAAAEIEGGAAINEMENGYWSAAQAQARYDAASHTPAATPPQPDIEPSFAPTEDFQVNTELTERNFGVSRTAGGRFDISKFRSEVAYNNLPTHSFLVQFAPMQWVNETIKTNEMLTLRCENAVMPAISMLQFDNLRRYGYGPIENTPYGYNMGDFTLQFLVDKNAQVVDFFEAWSNYIIDRKSFGGANMIGDTPGVSPYELKFKDEFACSVITVFVYDRSQNNIFEYNMYDVYPNNIQSMNLSWSDENQLMRLNVGFTFTDMQVKVTESKYSTTTLDPLEELVNKNLQDVQQQVQNTIAEIQDLNTSIPRTLDGVVDPINQPVAIGTGGTAVTTTGPSGETTDTTTNEEDITDGRITGSSSWEMTSDERTSGTRTTTTLNTPFEWV